MSSTVCLAIYFILVSGESIDSAVGVFRVEVECMVLNGGVQALYENVH